MQQNGYGSRTFKANFSNQNQNEIQQIPTSSIFIAKPTHSYYAWLIYFARQSTTLLVGGFIYILYSFNRGLIFCKATFW